jgi:hypothetical protein
MLIERVKSILFQPKETWPKIKAEPKNFSQVLTGYAMPLAALPAIFGLLGYVLIGYRYGVGPIGVVLRVPFISALIWAIVSYVLTLVGLYVEGIVINALAPSFGSKPDSLSAFKLAVYAYTPAFIAGILRIFPAIAFLVFLISLYGIYLLYLGLPVMMETPKEKIIVYLIVIIIVLIIIYAIIGAISGAVMTALWSPALF